MPQREEAAQPRVRLLSRRRPESRERMRPAEPPGPAGAVSISCGAVSPPGGRPPPLRRREARTRLGGRRSSVRGPQWGADREVVACCIQAPPVLFGGCGSGWRWKYLLWENTFLGVAWCGGNSKGFGVRPHGSMGRIPEPQCLHLPNGDNNALSWGWVTGCNELRL